MYRKAIVTARGDAADGAGNVISGNGGYGVRIDGNAATQNVVAGNSIGTNKDGTDALGNQQSGIVLSNGATDNTIGGTSDTESHPLSANHANRLHITRPSHLLHA